MDIKWLSQSWIPFLWKIILIPCNLVLFHWAYASIILGNVVLIRVLQRNIANRICVNIARHLLKELAHVIMEAGKPHICRKKAKRAVKVQRQSVGELSLAQRGWAFLFYSGVQLIGWGPPTKWHVTCSSFTNLNANLIPKHPPRWYIKLIITIFKMIFFNLKGKLDFIPKNSFVPKKIYHWKRLFFIPKKVWLLRKVLSIRQNFRLKANENTSLLLLWFYYL